MSNNVTHRRLVGTLAAWAVALSAAPAQDRPPDNATAARIAIGVEKAGEGKLLDAVEQFQRVLDTSGDELVPVDGRHHVPARWVVHGHLARLPPEGVNLYRQRVDGQAAKRLDEARKARDGDGLHRLLADMFPSTASEEAILELARRAFERGEFDAAEHYWSLLLPAGPDDDRLVRFPAPKTDAAAVRARLILVKLFRGERPEARDDLKAFAEQHPTAAGRLAGKEGKYIETLTALLDDPAQTTLAPLPDQSGWPTFAGSPTRTGTTRARLPYFWPDVATWRVSLPFVKRDRLESPRPDSFHPRSLAFHPVVADGRAYVSDGTRVLSIDPMTGNTGTAVWHNAGEEARLPTRYDVRYTLTAADGRLYARFGPAALRSLEGGAGGSFLVALGPRKDGAEDRDGLWKLDPPAAEGATTHFEGAPVAHRDRLYAAFWRQAGGEPVAGIACYRLDDPNAAPDLVWQRVVGKAGSEPNGETRYRHALVTISGANVVYCTDGGTVIALDLRTGRPAWEYRHPRNERPTLPRYRDLCPPLADGGRVYAAPADTDRLLCLDAYTGRLIWEREGVEVVHLLGVAKGRLVATFGGQVRGIRGLNLRTGADSGPGGWTIHDDGGEATFGRGLVTEEAIVWPTRHGLHFLDPADGTPLRAPIRGSFGNLCYADGVLIVTTATEVWGYVSEAKKLGDRRKAVEADPDNAALNADLAQSLIDAGRHAEAERAITRAGDATDRLRWLLAEKVIREGDRAGAERLYEELAKGDGSFAAAGAVRLAEMVGNLPKAREAWMAVFRQRGTIRTADGVPVPARTYAEMRSPHPLIMRGTGLVEDDFHGREGSLHGKITPPWTGYVRDTSYPINDPSLRVLHDSEAGIIAGGEMLHVFPDGKTIPLGWAPTRAAFEDQRKTCLGLPSGSVILTGPDRVESVYFHSGRVLWSVDLRANVPALSHLSRPPYPSASGAEEPPSAEGFQFFAWSMSFLYDRRALVGLAPHYGQFGRSLGPERAGARIHAWHRTDSGHSIIQQSNGRMQVRHAEEKKYREFPCTPKPWPEPPVPVSNDCFLIPGDGAAVLFDAKAGKELARYTIPGAESLTGELPRFRVHNGAVLLIVNRNHGVELDRLKLDTLQRTWDRSPILVGRELDDVAFREDRFFTAANGALSAHDWATGSPVWETPLPEAPHTRWRITVAPQGMLVHPAEALLLDPRFDAVGEFRRAGWDKVGVLTALSRSYDAWTARELPVLVIDPTDGRLVQRFTFPAAGPAAGVAVTPKGVVVVTGKGSWTLK